MLKPTPPPPDKLAKYVGSLARFGDPTSRLKAEHKVVVMIAIELRKHGYEALATFLELRPASGPPVLAAAVHYFFQREVEEDRELFQGLAFAQMDSLAQGQSAGFASLADALDKHGERLEELLTDVHAAVVQTRADVLDVKAELQRQGQQMQELGDAVLKALHQHHLEKRTLHTGDSLSIRDESERRLVKDLVRQYRSLPPEQRQKMPALLNAVGKLEVVAGEFESAERDFRELAGMVEDSSARAEAAHNAYLAALERRAWADALSELKEAARMDASRFAPFPLEKFEPERILGAGGFGVAFLCRNTRSGGRVVIKTLRSEGMDRDVKEVFREAQTLEALEHPAIIRIRDCDFADPERSRPYLVMDYFQGQTLAEHVEQNGPLKINETLHLARVSAEGLQRAHQNGILHRDVKPANLLVRPSQKGWEVRLIDFGLALRAPTKGSTRRSSLDRTLAGASIAGTLEYAAPEQMGKLKGVAVGTYSDIYGFGKTCCFALFGTASPTFQHWQKIPPALADLLGRCINEQPSARPQDFAAVLGELERLASSSGTRSGTPRILDAQPVRSRPATTVPTRAEAPRLSHPEPEPPRRRHEPREKRGETDNRPRRRASGAWWVIGLVDGVPALFLVWFGIVCAGWLFRPSPIAWKPPVDGSVANGGNGFPLVNDTDKNDPLKGLGGLPRIGGTTKGKSGIPGMGNWPGPSFPGGATSIPPSEFKDALATLQKKPSPSIEELRRLADRFALTMPTEKQKDQREAVKRMLAAGSAGPGLAILEQARLADDMLHVSRALNPLLRDSDPANKKSAALAMQRWGTEENVDDLVANVEGTNITELFMRIEVARALAFIGDARGTSAVTRQVMGSFHDRAQGMKDVLIAFGSRAEPAVRSYLKSTKRDEKKTACEILKQIGTESSIPDLEALSIDRFVGRQAKDAIAAIRARKK